MLEFIGLAIIAVAVDGSVSGLTGSAARAQETVQSMLAAQIRMQGFTCDKALGAVKDAKRSKPDRGV